VRVARFGDRQQVEKHIEALEAPQA